MLTLILGYGVTGRGVERFLRAGKESFIVCDEGSTIALPFEVALEQSPDRAVLSPGIPLTHPWVQALKERKIPVISEFDLAANAVKTKKLLAVTGTNGKTTVTLLVDHILRSQGVKSQYVGNVGVSFLDYVSHVDLDVLVVELSSYQIENSHKVLYDAGLCLNISPDHLDRYSSFEAYAKAKAHLENLLKSQAPFYINHHLREQFPEVFREAVGPTFGYSEQADYKISEKVFQHKDLEYILPLGYRGRGSYEVENIVAAFCLCQTLGVTWPQFLEGLKSFKKPSHRMEHVATIDNVHYYNDSKGTNIEAVIRGVGSLSGDVILIAGGVDKGSPYTPWVTPFRDRVKQVYAMGEAADNIIKDLGTFIPVKKVENLESAIAQAKNIALPGMNVLLSPGCSSFDMFKNYEERGNQFRAIVETNAAQRENV